MHRRFDIREERRERKQRRNKNNNSRKTTFYNAIFLLFPVIIPLRRVCRLKRESKSSFHQRSRRFLRQCRLEPGTCVDTSRTRVLSLVHSSESLCLHWRARCGDGDGERREPKKIFRWHFDLKINDARYFTGRTSATGNAGEHFPLFHLCSAAKLNAMNLLLSERRATKSRNKNIFPPAFAFNFGPFERAPRCLRNRTGSERSQFSSMTFRHYVRIFIMRTVRSGLWYPCSRSWTGFACRALLLHSVICE